MIRKVFVGAILVLHLVQSSYALPLAQHDAPRPMSMQEPTGVRQAPPMIPIPVQLPSEIRQDQPMMPMSMEQPTAAMQAPPMMIQMPVQLPIESRQEQQMPDGSMQMPDGSMQMPHGSMQMPTGARDQMEPMPMHTIGAMMIARLRNPSRAKNAEKPTHESASVHDLKKVNQHEAHPVHENNDHLNEMQMRGDWRDQPHNQDHMHHAHMTHNHESHNMMGPIDEHKPERNWSRAPNHPADHEPNIHKHVEPHDQMDKPDQMQKSSAEQLHKHAMEQSHPSKARSEEVAKPNRFSNQLVGMQQARQEYQSQQQYRPSSLPCSRLVVGCSPTVQEVPCSYGSAPAPYHPAAPPAYQSATYYAPAPIPQYHSYPSYPSAPSYPNVHQQPGPPYVDALLGTTHVDSLHEKLHGHPKHHHHQHELVNHHQNMPQAHEHPNHKMNGAQHKDSHPEATNVKTHSNQNEPEKDTENAAEKQYERESTKLTATTPEAPTNHAVSELKKKIQDHTHALERFREAAEDRLRESVMKSNEAQEHKAHEIIAHEHKHQHDSCVQACSKKLLQSQQMLQENRLE